MAPEETANLIFVSINILICLTVLVDVLVNLKNHPDLIKKRAVVYCVLCCTVLYTINTILKILETTYPREDIWNLLFYFMDFISYHSAQCLTYALFIHRIYHTFKCTEFASSNRTYFLLCIGILLFWLEGFYLCVIFGLYQYQVIDYSVLDDHHTAEVLSKAMIDLFLSITMMYIFFNKIRLLLKSNVVKNDEQRGLLSIASKIFILSTVSLLSTQCLASIASANCILFGSVPLSPSRAAYSGCFGLHNQCHVCLSDTAI